MLDDPDRGVALSAMESFGKIGIDAASALDPLMEEALRPRLTSLGEPAAKALWGIDPQGRTIIPILLDAREIKSKRRGANLALRMIGPEARPAIPMLLGILGDSDSTARATSAACIGKLGPVARKAIPALFRAMNDRNPAVAEAATKALKQVRARR